MLTLEGNSNVNIQNCTFIYISDYEAQKFTSFTRIICHRYKETKCLLKAIITEEFYLDCDSQGNCCTFTHRHSRGSVIACLNKTQQSFK